jgi:hypothetical protein
MVSVIFNILLSNYHTYGKTGIITLNAAVAIVFLPGWGAPGWMLHFICLQAVI